MKLLLWFLKQRKLSQQSKIEIINYLLTSVNALPIKDIIDFTPDGSLKINGKILEPQQAIQLRESLIALNKNWSRQIINEQITFEAIKRGVHLGQSLDTIMFSKAALWLIAQENELITKIIGQTEEKSV